MAQKREKHEEILKKIPIFSDLSPGSVAVIADCLSRENYSAGDCILQEGQPLESDAKFYIVEKGTVQCYKTFETGRQLVKTFEAGGFFGEVALVSKQSRQADCVALTDVWLLSMSRDAFERLMGPVETTLQHRIKEYTTFNETLINAV